MQSDSLYTGMAGLQAIRARMQALSSNIANTNTPGYAAVQAISDTAYYQGSNAPVGGDVLVSTPGPDLRQGALNRTGDPLDVGLGGDAWLQVQTANGMAVTRNGQLQISAAGLLTDAGGNPVLGVGGQPISLPQLTNVTIAQDGTISGVPASAPGGKVQTYGQIALVSAQNVTLTPLSGSLYTPPSGTTLPASQNGSLHQGYLNDSNVDPTMAMMSMINDSRDYQLQTELMKSQSAASRDMNNILSQA
ncbi:flagellar hook-basal body complex protein [Acidocella sp.]|uniref:flagellar hook-basal body complex protein n=1 Tax=Acidocella sp. TaxID=50710 RepID=UPI00260B938B|nr:flagellar hook-basal body complex protein [Acidocella sp.]